MGGSREDSPDWLRTFQAPTYSPVTLSSDSESGDALSKGSPSSDYRFGSQSLARRGIGDDDEEEEEEDDVTVNRAQMGRSVDSAAPKTRKRKTAEDGSDGNVQGQDTSEKHMEAKNSVWALSSDSEYCSDDEVIAKRKKTEHQVMGTGDDEDLVVAGSNLKSPLKKAAKKKSPKKQLKAEGLTAEETNVIDVVQRKASDDGEVAKDTSEKHISSRTSTSALPLVLSEKVHRSKALVECEGDSVDLSGDMGAVGRIVISDTPSGDHEMYFDLKGTIYRTSIVPSRTFCVVSFGQSEAKIEAIMNDFIQLKPQSNVYEAETMVEGTLEGFSFESEDEADKVLKGVSHQNDQDGPPEDKSNGKTKGKARKSSGVAQKKVKTGGGGAKSHPAKKARKKTQAPKKNKTKK